ncbi:ribonuclease R [Aquisalimonas asiatica]|uniref:ribonuclease R n=1 Tax=Aquisalimonas asiatica TaxID=406100 RepID=UPI000B87F60A|nr:ribonuclease R [Aquisalimonas asiatica]
MTRKRKQADAGVDPYREREAQKYDNPVPSREHLMTFIADQARPLTRDELAQALGLSDPDSLEGLRRRLIAMERDGQVVRNRRRGYVLVDNEELVRGRVIGHQDGYGQLAPDVGGERIFISPRDMRLVMHGDRAVVRVTGVNHEGQPSGILVDVIQRANKTVVGRFFQESGVGFVVPSNKRMHHDIIVPSQSQQNAGNGELVVVQITQQPQARRQPIGEVIQVLGEHIRPGTEIETAQLIYGIPVEWPEAVTKELERLPDEVPEADKKGRKDLRNLPLITIDGADARDFDDAVYAEPKPSGWRLVVAIADVSHYVKPGSALDKEARNRGNSVYFPRNVVPMLPEKLSNGLCSLNPDVDRLCMVCDMLITTGGEIRRSTFYRAVMRSHARMIYEDVARILVDQDEALQAKYAPILPQLDHLYGVYESLRKARNRRGAIDFETTETQILFDDHGSIADIRPTERTDAHRLIEECMLAANQATARYLLKQRLPTLFRNHDGPDEDRLDNLNRFLAETGLALGGGDDPQPADYAKLLRSVQNRPDRHLIQTVMLRSLQQAVYHPVNSGHFGLAMEEYAHFTSPIRRYPDLLVHRGIAHVIEGGKGTTFPVGQDELLGLGEQCSMTERRADEATRDAESILKCQYIRDKVGQEYDGVVTGVTGFGLFVELDGLYVDGLVHVTQLENDFFRFDPIGHHLTGERTGRVYRLTDRVRVRIDKVDPDERKVDLAMLGPLDANGELAEPVTDGSRGGRKPGKGGKGGPGKRDGGKGRRRRSGGKKQ